MSESPTPTPTPTPPSSRAIVDECTFEYGRNGIVASLKYLVQGIFVDPLPPPDPDGDPADDTAELLAYPIKWLAAALAIDGIPQRGDGITIDKIGEMFCSNLRVQHFGNSKTQAHVIATFEELGIQFDANQPLRWLAGFDFTSSTSNTTTSFSPTTGDLFKVQYEVGIGNAIIPVDDITPANIASGQVLVQYVKVPSLESLFSFKFRLRELNNPKPGDNGDYPNSLIMLQKKFSGATNSVKIWGMNPGFLRMRVFIGSIDATRSPVIKDVNNPTTADNGSSQPGLTYVYDTEYYFEVRDRLTGWKELATLKYPWTGFEPPDIENPGPVLKTNADPATAESDKRYSGNGWGLFDANKTADFNELNLPDPRKLEPYTRSTADALNP